MAKLRVASIGSNPQGQSININVHVGVGKKGGKGGTTRKGGSTKKAKGGGLKVVKVAEPRCSQKVHRLFLLQQAEQNPNRLLSIEVQKMLCVAVAYVVKECMVMQVHSKNIKIIMLQFSAFQEMKQINESIPLIFKIFFNLKSDINKF